MSDNQISLIKEARALCDSIIITDSMWKSLDPVYAEKAKEPLERRLKSIVKELAETFELQTA